MQAIINPNTPGLDRGVPIGQRVSTRTSRFGFSSAAGAVIAQLVDPFGGGSTFETAGVVPPQLALSGDLIVRGNGAAVAGTDYWIWIVVVSPEGIRQPAVRLVFQAQLPLGGTPVVIPSPTPSPSPTPTPTPGPTPSVRFSMAGAGQSLQAYDFSRGTPNVAVFMAELLRGYLGSTATRAFGRYNLGDIVHDGSSQTAEDYNVRLDNYASGGSAVLSSNSPASDLANGNYWWNDQDNSAVTGGTNPAPGGVPGSQDTAGTPGPLLRNAIAGITTRRAAGAPPQCVSWSQGTAEGGLNGSDGKTALYKQVLRDEIFGRMRTAAGSAIPVFIYRNGRHQVASDDAQERVRRVQTELAAEVAGVHIAGEEYPHRMAISGGSTGDTTAGSNLISNVANMAPFGQKQGIQAAGFPIGSYISTVGTNALSVSIKVNGVETPANCTTTASGVAIYNLDNVHLYPGSTAQPLDTPEGTPVGHDTTAGFYALRRVGAKFIAQKMGFANVPAAPIAAGPYISGVSAERGSDTVMVDITHVGGTDLTTWDNTAWRVRIDNVVTAVASVTKVSATRIALKLATTVSGDLVDVQYAWGTLNAIDRTKLIFDNAGYPMQARQAVSANTSPNPAALTATSLALPAANSTGGSSFTFTGVALGAANTVRDLMIPVTAFASAARSISAVSVDGVAATLVPGSTQHADASSSNRATAAFYRVRLDETHGDTGNVVVTMSAGANSCAIAIEQLTGIGSIKVALFSSAAGASPAPVDVAYKDGSIILVGVAYASAAASGNRKQAVFKRTMAGTGTLSVSPTWSADDIAIAGFTEVTDRLVSTSGTPSTAGTIAVISR